MSVSVRAVVGWGVVSFGLVALASCTTTSASLPSGEPPAERAATASPTLEPVPGRITIRPDDYHVPYAGTAEDGRRFFLSSELFEPGGASYVAVFLWRPDGRFDELVVDRVRRPSGVPPGQATRAGSAALVKARLRQLGDYTLEPIRVEPFIERRDGVRFGWRVGHYDDGTAYVNIEPGDFIAYYAPWDGRGYDT